MSRRGARGAYGSAGWLDGAAGRFGGVGIRVDGPSPSVGGCEPPAERRNAGLGRLGGGSAKADGFSPASRHNCAARGRPPGSVAKAAGFTLIEVLLATVLLAAGLSLAFATLVAATRTANRGEAMAEQGERVRAVEGFLRQRIAAARPVPFAVDTATALPQRFIGEADRLRFVADLPNYLGRGGPYLHDFTVTADGGDTRITLALTQVLAGEQIEDREPRAPELLVDGLASARFRYRAMGNNNALGEWSERWEKVEELPLLVEVALTDADGRAWPPLVVALPLAPSHSTAGEAF